MSQHLHGDPGPAPVPLPASRGRCCRRALRGAQRGSAPVLGHGSIQGRSSMPHGCCGQANGFLQALLCFQLMEEREVTPPSPNTGSGGAGLLGAVPAGQRCEGPAAGDTGVKQRGTETGL